MNMVRSFLLGTAALFAGSLSAQAADLAAAEPVEYVKICDAYGAGYFFIPGSSDTCLRISGYVRTYFAYQGRNQSNSSGQIDSAATSTINPVIVNANGINTAAGIVANVPGVNVAGTNFGNPLNLVNYGNYGAVGNDIALAAGGDANARARLTSLGPNYILFANAETSDQYVSGIRALLRFDARTKTEWGVLRSFFEFAAATSNAARNGTGVQVRFGFVQFGPITAGVTESFFNTTASNLFLSAFGDQTRRVPTLAYTASLGNGVSVTLAADDSSIAFGAPPGGIGSAQTGLLINSGNWVRRAVQLPDAVGNIRIAQDWGNAQISGAVGQFRFANTACTANFALGATCTANRVGWAIATGVQINLPAIARGDTFLVRASYSEGALHYLGSVTTQSYFGNANNAGTVSTRTGFAVLGEFNHFFTPAIRSSIVGSYTRLGRNPGATFGANTVNLREAWQIAGQLFWTPVRGFDVGVELFYQDLSFNAFGAGALGNRVIGSVNDAGWGGFFRIQRTF